MAAKSHSGLGRGLGELFARTDTPEPTASNSAGAHSPDATTVAVGQQQSAPLADGSYLALLRVDQVQPNPRQPRSVFAEDELTELADSIREVGVLQPIVVRELGQGRFELIMGERRLRASKLAGLQRVPAIVRATEDANLLRDALLENLHRAQLNPLEEAAAYRQLLDDFGCTQEELGSLVQRSRPHISNTLRLLKLSGPVQRMIADGELDAGHARALLAISDQQVQAEWARLVATQDLSVRATEQLVAQLLTPKPEQKPQPIRQPSPRAAELSTSLSERFDARVRVDIGARKGKGKIVIEFTDADELDRIIAIVEGRDR